MDDSRSAEADRAAIRSTTAELLAAVNASNADRVLAVWADDGVLMPPHHPSVQGRAALDRYFRLLFSQQRLRFTFTSSTIEVAGDLAFERITYTAAVRSTRGDLTGEDAGKGLHVYQRQPDGSWKLTQDIWNSDQPIRLL